MIQYTEIKDIRTKKVIGLMAWGKAGKKTFRLPGFEVYADFKELNEIEPATKAKVELLLNNVYRMKKTGVIKTIKDLELYVNSFIFKHSPYVTFSNKKEFTFNESSTFSTKEYKKRFSEMYTQLDDRHYKTRMMKDMKKLRKK